MFIVTSKSNYPQQSLKGEKITKYNMQTNFDEAGYIIPQQVVTAFKQGKKTIKVTEASNEAIFENSCSSFLGDLISKIARTNLKVPKNSSFSEESRL